VAIVKKDLVERKKAIGSLFLDSKQFLSLVLTEEDLSLDKISFEI